MERRLNLFTRFIPQPKGSDIVRENLDFRVKSIHVDDVGRFIILDSLIQDSLFLLVNIYMHHIIADGDFNATFDPDLDCSGGRPSVKDCIKNLNNIMLKNDLSDIWKVRNPLTKRYTWRQKHHLIQRRLDFWLTSNSLQDDIEKNRYFNFYQN